MKLSARQVAKSDATRTSQSLRLGLLFPIKDQVTFGV